MKISYLCFAIPVSVLKKLTCLSDFQAYFQTPHRFFISCLPIRNVLQFFDMSTPFLTCLLRNQKNRPQSETPL